MSASTTNGAKTDAERSAGYATRQRAKGLTRKAFWIPASEQAQAELKRFIDELTARHST